jgi:dolichol-phosphate mannosyltransferase
MLLKFGVVGLAGVGVNMVAYKVALTLGCHYILASLLAFVVAVTNNFFWNVRWTFKGRAPSVSLRRKYVIFVTISTINLGVNLILLRLLVESVRMDEMLAQLLSIAAVSVLNFILNYAITFNEPK